jgi:flavodoxin
MMKYIIHELTDIGISGRLPEKEYVKMSRVIILYAPEDQSMINSANNIRAAFENEGCETAVKAAESAAMPDIAAADILILGSLPKGKKPIHPDFKEITRALQGINLAGKTAGIFTLDQENTITSFRDILHDSDITLCDEGFFIAKENNNSPAEADWVKKIISLNKERCAHE